MDKIRSAIAQIKVGPSRGTGFLVSNDGLVLSALHVVADLKENKNKSPDSALKTKGAKIALRFGDPRQLKAGEALIEAEAQVEPGCYSVEEDWALLRVTSPLSIKPLPLINLPDGANEIVWDSWGFSDTDPELGTWYRGSLIPRPESPKLELYSDQAAGGSGGMIPGLSGAPLLVANEVVGLVQSALLETDDQDKKRSIEGKIFARRLGSIVERCKLRFADDEDRIPFANIVLSCLDRLLKDERRAVVDLAKGLNLDVALVPDDALPRRITRRLASVTFERAYLALRAIAGQVRKSGEARDDLFELVRLAALLNLHPAAVETVQMGGARHAQALGAWLSCDWTGSAELFTQRAHAGDWPHDWERRTVDVDLTSREGTAEAVIDYVRVTLGDRFDSWKQRKDFPGLLRDKDFCLILRNPLAPEYLETVCREFEKARVLMATSRTTDAAHAAWLPVRPDLSPDFEQQVGESFDSFGK